MVALLVAMAIMAVALSVALPSWKTAAQREREEELIFRGTQYARAIALYQRKFRQRLSPERGSPRRSAVPSPQVQGSDDQGRRVSAALHGSERRTGGSDQSASTGWDARPNRAGAVPPVRRRAQVLAPQEADLREASSASSARAIKPA
jgi:type II secretory pathway pseudopilin PulG